MSHIFDSKRAVRHPFYNSAFLPSRWANNVTIVPETNLNQAHLVSCVMQWSASRKAGLPPIRALPLIEDGLGFAGMTACSRDSALGATCFFAYITCFIRTISWSGNIANVSSTVIYISRVRAQDGQLVWPLRGRSARVFCPFVASTHRTHARFQFCYGIRYQVGQVT